MAGFCGARLSRYGRDFGAAEPARRGAGLYRQFYEATRKLAFPREGPARARTQYAQAAKLLGDHSQGLAQLDAYREAVRIWSQLVEDTKTADVAAKQYDVILGLARVFDAKKDWPDAQVAYRAAMKIATLNYVKNPADAAWRDKAEEAERASVGAQQAAEMVPANAPH